MGYTSIWNHKAAEIEAVARELAERYPQAWQAAHNPQRGDKRQREEFCQRLCIELRRRGIPAGMNGKRGNPNDLSEDIIALPNVDEFGRSHGGARDTSGQFEAIEIRDIIASAGPDRNGNQGGRISFGDVTVQTIEQGTVGCFVMPTPQDDQPQRPPVGGDVGQQPPSVPPVPPQQGPSYAELQAQVAELTGLVRTALSGIGTLATQVGDLESKLLNHDGAFDRLTKRVFGVDGSGDPGIAEEVVVRIQGLEPEQRVGGFDACKVVPALRRR